jgi:hypothetical protein
MNLSQIFGQKHSSSNLSPDLIFCYNQVWAPGQAQTQIVFFKRKGKEKEEDSPMGEAVMVQSFKSLNSPHLLPLANTSAQ